MGEGSVQVVPRPATTIPKRIKSDTEQITTTNQMLKQSVTGQCSRSTTASHDIVFNDEKAFKRDTFEMLETTAP